jgi:hypothetical protein
MGAVEMGSITIANAETAAALAIALAKRTRRQTRLRGRGRSVCQAEIGQRQAGQAHAEFPERFSPCGGLGHAFGEVIEFGIHTFPFCLLLTALLLAGARLRTGQIG